MSVVTSATAVTEIDAGLAPYQPRTAVVGEIRIWGQRAMAAVVAAWANGFQRFHPGARIAARLMGSGTATPGLYAGQADVALLGRENNVTDINGFGRVKQYAPLRLELMGGSLATPGQSSALGVFVHRRNPLAKISLQQLSNLFGCESPAGGAAIRRWGQLGLGGRWAARPVHIYSVDLETGTGIFLQRAALAGNMKLNWPAITEFRDLRRADGSLVASAAEQILRALSRDPDGLAVAHAGAAIPGIKFLLLATRTDGPYFDLTPENLISGAYPLGRRTYAFVDRPPGKPLAPAIDEFLRYALSREGQQDVANQTGYLPLSAVRVRAQLEQLR